MSIKSVQDYSITQTAGLRSVPIFKSSSGVWVRNPAWLKSVGIKYTANSSFSASFDSVVTSIQVQSDGKILVGGFFNNVISGYITRLNSDGTSDSTFNTNKGSGFNDLVNIIKIQSDGKILVGGNFTTYKGSTAKYLTRLNSDGTIDSSFNASNSFNNYVRAIEIQSDGRILVGGDFTTFNGTTYNRMVRLNSDGTIDALFNNGTGFDARVNFIRMQPDGKILVGGSFSALNGNYDNHVQYGFGRLNSDGSSDTTFTQTFNGGGYGEVNGIEVLPDGKILVAGNMEWFTTSEPSYLLRGLIRYNSDGSHDLSFVLRDSLSTFSTVTSLYVQSDGKILIGGTFTSVQGITVNGLTRLNRDGSYDSSFDIGTGFNSYANAVAVLPNNNILVGGWFSTFQGNNTITYFAALNITEQKVKILKAVFPKSDFAAFTCAGNNTIDWGDGVVENFTSGTQANHQYDYANTFLANTDGPVIFTDTGDLVTRTYHGYASNDIISFSTITNTTGITVDTPYYVANTTANTFQLSNTAGGNVVSLFTDGTGTLLPYKQAIITITPQAGANLTQTLLTVKNSNTANKYETGFLDMGISVPNVNSFRLSSSGQILYLKMLESAYIKNLGVTDLTSLFHSCSSLQSVGIDFNTSNVTNITNMFQNCYSLRSIPLFDTSKVTNMGYTFAYCTSLKNVPQFDTANVTNMYGMFTFCPSLDSVPLFDTSKVTDMGQMFYNCFSLKSVPLFDTRNVTNMYGMFWACSSLQSLPLFDTSKVTTMSNMFVECFSLKLVPLFNTRNVTDMNGMFYSCKSLKSVPLFDTSKVTDMFGMFNLCRSLESVPQFNTANVTIMNSMFNNCHSLQTVPLFDTGKVTNMGYMFRECYSLKSVPLFDTSKVTEMYSMFTFCTSLKSVPQFNTANVTNMFSMFGACTELESVPQFNTINVQQMYDMFYNCVSLKSVPQFNTANVTNISNMFGNCVSLKSVPLFDTRKATTMTQMFSGCSTLESVPQFNTANVTAMRNMFSSCYSLQSVPLFDTRNVTDMYSMFQYCYSLQRVPAFDTSKVTDMAYIVVAGESLRELPAWNCASVSSAGNFTNSFAYGYSLARSQVTNVKYSHNYAGNLLSNTALDEIYTNLPTVSGQTITITGNWGAANSNTTIATSKGWTVTN